MRLLHLYLAVGALLIISGTIWINLPQSVRGSLPGDEHEVPKKSRQFDTTGGQEMKPRWND